MTLGTVGVHHFGLESQMVLRKLEGRTAKVRLRHETCNKRIKQYNILAVRYRHDVMRHQIYFGAIVALTNLALEDEPLFSVDY